MPEPTGPKVIGVDDVTIKLVKYRDNAGRVQVTPVAVVGDSVVKFRDDQLILDRRNTPDFIVEGVREHAEALKDDGAKEA